MAEGRRIRVKFTVPFPGHFFTDDVKIEKSRHAMGMGAECRRTMENAYEHKNKRLPAR